MIIRPWAAVFLLMLVAAPASAQSGENVAVVINDASPASREIGEYDVAKRAVPEPNVIRIRVTTEDAISRAAFAAGIGQPIAAALRQRGLQDRVLYIVLTKGVPLRITGTTGPGGTMASVDSELTLLYRSLTGKGVASAGHIDNPYLPRCPADSGREALHPPRSGYLSRRAAGRLHRQGGPGARRPWIDSDVRRTDRARRARRRALPGR